MAANARDMHEQDGSTAAGAAAARAWLAALVAALPLLAGGCYSDRGEVLRTYERGGPAHVMLAPDDGTYALYRKDDLSSPRRTVQLHRGQPLGFKKYQDGTVAAVAGDREFPIGNSDYVWKRQ